MIPAPVKSTLPRAVFHASAGIIISLALYFLLWLPVLIALAFATAAFIVFDMTRLRLPGLGRLFSRWFAPYLRRAEDARLTGASYFLIGCLVSAAAFPVEIAVLAVLFLSFGDPAATVIGTWKGRTRLWGKSIEGNAACLAVCLIIAVVVSVLLNRPGFAVAMTGAVIASIFQALRLPLNDNLTIPIGSGLCMLAVSLLTG